MIRLNIADVEPDRVEKVRKRLEAPPPPPPQPLALNISKTIDEIVDENWAFSEWRDPASIDLAAAVSSARSLERIADALDKLLTRLP